MYLYTEYLQLVYLKVYSSKYCLNYLQNIGLIHVRYNFCNEDFCNEYFTVIPSLQRKKTKMQEPDLVGGGVSV